MRTLSLFSGIGGLDLGLERAGFEIVAQCEADPFARAVLRKHWPGVRCFEDVRAMDATTLDVDAVVGGFPCQDVSCAGRGLGIEHGERSGLWREFARIVREARPRWVIAENVPALRTRGADRVLGDLEAIGYTCWPLVVGAEHVGAPHRRHRVFIVAHAERGEWAGPCLRKAGRMGRKSKSVSWDEPWPSALRRLRGVDDGTSYGVDRTDGIRNAVVPQVAEVVGRAVMAMEKQL